MANWLGMRHGLCAAIATSYWQQTAIRHFSVIQIFLIRIRNMLQDFLNGGDITGLQVSQSIENSGRSPMPLAKLEHVIPALY
jgi:arabinogalactan endo-1,4-beta-galactosidase